MADGHGAAQRAGDVNVIVDAADFMRGAAEVVASCGEITDEFGFDGFVDEGLAMFCAEDDVEEDVGEGLSHDEGPIKTREKGLKNEATGRRLNYVNRKKKACKAAL
jgi:hypothetical protein